MYKPQIVPWQLIELVPQMGSQSLIWFKNLLNTDSVSPLNSIRFDLFASTTSLI